MMYRVALDSFHGPLDLLLHLVQRHEVDIHDIPIALLTEQFLNYLGIIKLLDVDVAGDFLVMAATLMEIKSRSLIPVEAILDEAPIIDPRRELVKQLLEYRRYKDAASILEQRIETHAQRRSRIVHDDGQPLGETPMRPVELWDLVSAFARIMRETQAMAARTITIDDTPQEVYERRVLAEVQSAGRMPFRDLFRPPYLRMKLIGLFLAVLELIKAHAIELDQPSPFDEIWLMTVAKT